MQALLFLDKDNNTYKDFQPGSILFTFINIGSISEDVFRQEYIQVCITSPMVQELYDKWLMCSLEAIDTLYLLYWRFQDQIIWYERRPVPPVSIICFLSEWTSILIPAYPRHHIPLPTYWTSLLLYFVFKPSSSFLPEPLIIL